MAIKLMEIDLSSVFPLLYSCVIDHEIYPTPVEETKYGKLS